jgi:hypothetical protein
MLNKYEDRLPKWVLSQNSSGIYQYNYLPEELRLQIRQEDKFTLTMIDFDTQSKVTIES